MSLKYLVHGAEGAVVLLDELTRGGVELGVRRRVEHRPFGLHGVSVHHLRLHAKLGEPRHHGHVFGLRLAEHPERARGRELGFRGRPQARVLTQHTDPVMYAFE